MAEIGFEPAKYILLIVYEQIRKTTDTYEKMVEALTTLSRPETEINLNVLLGQNEPTTREEAGFLNRYFPSLDNDGRQALFRRLNFDKLQITPDMYIKFTESGSQIFIWILPKAGDFHLSIPKSDTVDTESLKPYEGLIHMTEEFTKEFTKYREYYKWDDPAKRIQRKEPIGGPEKPNAEGLAFTLRTSPQPSPSDSGGNTSQTFVESSKKASPSLSKLYIASNDTNTPPTYYIKRGSTYTKYTGKLLGGKRRSTRRRRALRKTRKAYI